MKLNKFYTMILFVFLSASVYSDDKTQKICYIKDQETKKLARKGATKAIEFCKKGDLLVIARKGWDQSDISIAVARVCQIPFISHDLSPPSTVSICLYTGSTLVLANEY
jgi:hypothetical protein